MNTFNHVVVMGAGAVGGYFGGRIAERTSARVVFIARGAHLQAIQENGLQIKSIAGDAVINVEAFEDPSEGPKPDLILFTVKSYDTLSAIHQVKPIVGVRTQILTIQNGIENYPQLVEAFGTDRVIQGFCKIGAGIARPGVIEHKAFGEITVGEKDGRDSARLKSLSALCKEAGIPLHISSDIDREVWLKFGWNSVLNMLTAVADVTVDKLFIAEHTTALCYHIFDEVRKVAAAEDIEITAEDGKKMIDSARGLKGFTTSTYQDRQKGKKMEYEAFTGAIVRLAQKHNILVPHNETLYGLLKAMDNGQ